MFDRSARLPARVMTVLLATALGQFCWASGREAPPLLNFNIKNPKSFVLKDGINQVVFWGIRENYASYDVRSKLGDSPFHQPATIVVAETSNGLANLPTLYLTMAPGVSTADAVLVTGVNNDIITSIADIGQSESSAVRFFNGTWNGHCQTFLVVANGRRDEETGISRTTINLFDYEPSFTIKGRVASSPIFNLLTTYQSSRSNEDPDYVPAQEFSLPLPHQYELQTFSQTYTKPGQYDASLSKQLGVPMENSTNTYLDPSKAGNAC